MDLNKEENHAVLVGRTFLPRKALLNRVSHGEKITEGVDYDKSHY
jgi:hypothetical protein